MAEFLHPRQVQRLAALVLFARHRPDGPSDDLCAIGPHIQAERQHPGLQRRQGNTQKRQHEIGPEQLDEDRRAAKEFDIGRGQPAQLPKAGYPAQAGGEGGHQRQRAAQHRDLRGHQGAVENQADISVPLFHCGSRSLKKAGRRRWYRRPNVTDQFGPPQSFSRLVCIAASAE